MYDYLQIVRKKAECFWDWSQCLQRLRMYLWLSIMFTWHHSDMWHLRVDCNTALHSQADSFFHSNMTLGTIFSQSAHSALSQEDAQKKNTKLTPKCTKYFWVGSNLFVVIVSSWLWATVHGACMYQQLTEPRLMCLWAALSPPPSSTMRGSNPT